MKTQFILLFISIILIFSCKSSENNSNNEEGYTNSNYLTIEGDDIWVRDAPSDGEVVFKLNSGDKCKVLEKGKAETIEDVTDCWYKIEFEEKEGWVFGSQTSLRQEQDEEQVEDPIEEKELTKEEQLQQAVDNIIIAISKKDKNQLSEYFYSEDKTIFINNPGMFIMISDISATDVFENIFYDVNENCELKFEKWAEYDIGSEEWNKTGCFAEKIDNTDFFKNTYIEMREYEIAEVEDADINKAEQIGNITEMKVLITKSLIRLYFTYKNNKWQITAIDVHDFSA